MVLDIRNFSVAIYLKIQDFEAHISITGML